MAEHSPGNPSTEQSRIPSSDTRLTRGYFQNLHSSAGCWPCRLVPLAVPGTFTAAPMGGCAGFDR